MRNILGVEELKSYEVIYNIDTYEGKQIPKDKLDEFSTQLSFALRPKFSGNSDFSKLN